MAVFNERIEEVIGVPGNYPTPGPMKPALFYNLTNVKVSANGAKHEVPSSETDPRQSILSQRQDPVGSYEITWLGRLYRQIAIYREWILGPESPARRPQKTDLLPNHLEPNCRNLALVINRLRSNGAAKHKLMECMRELIDGFVDCQVDILGGTALLLVDEGKFNVPANRLSDGTLRYLSLLAVLLDPEPPQLVCIDEPELGLHPDLIVKVGELLVEASERMQLIVTTHSSVLVDALNRRAEDIVVCQRGENGTQMRRLEKREMDKWLEKYSLSELWSSGQIGGNRW
jgi:predicted ATPase